MRSGWVSTCNFVTEYTVPCCRAGRSRGRGGEAAVRQRQGHPAGAAAAGRRRQQQLRARVGAHRLAAAHRHAREEVRWALELHVALHEVAHMERDPVSCGVASMTPDRTRKHLELFETSFAGLQSCCSLVGLCPSTSSELSVELLAMLQGAAAHRRLLLLQEAVRCSGGQPAQLRHDVRRREGSGAEPSRYHVSRSCQEHSTMCSSQDTHGNAFGVLCASTTRKPMLMPWSPVAAGRRSPGYDVLHG